MAWSLLASTNATGAGNTTTPAINTTGASLLVVVIAASGSSTIADSQSNAWVDSGINIGANGENRLWYVITPVTTNASHTVTVSNPVSGGLFGAIDFLAYSGAAVSPFDVANHAAATQPGSITPSQPGDLLITGCSFSAGAGSVSFDSGFTNQLFTDFSSGVNYGLGVATLVQGAPAAINPTVTLGGAVSPNQTFIVAFKAAPVTNIAAKPSTLLLPPSRGMVGWRGLRSLQAIRPPPPTVSLAGIVTTQAKLLAQPRGIVPIAGSVTTQTKVQAAMRGVAALTGRATTEAKAQGALTGTAALRGQVTTQTKVQARITGIVPLAGAVATQAKAFGSIVFAAFLTGRVTTMAKIAAPLVGSAALAGRVTTQAKASAQATGVVGLAGQVTTQAKVLGRAAAAIFLSGRVTTMAKASAALAGTVALAGRVTTQAKASAPLTGFAALAGTVTTQAKTFGLATAGVFAFLQGRVTTQAKMAGAQIGAVTLAGYITAQTKVRALPPAPLGPAAGTHWIRASNTKFITPGSGVS